MSDRADGAAFLALVALAATLTLALMLVYCSPLTPVYDNDDGFAGAVCDVAVCVTPDPDASWRPCIELGVADANCPLILTPEANQ